MSWWNTEPHSGEYGRQTVVPPAWPEVDEEVLSQASATYERFRDYLRMEVIPQLRSQMMRLADAWEGAGSQAALAEASEIINQHEQNANRADAIGRKIRNMESSVVKTKIAVNSNAEATQLDCEATNNSGLDVPVAQALNRARVAKGYGDNTQLVSANSVELAGNIDAPVGTPGADGTVPGQADPPRGAQTGGQGASNPGDRTFAAERPYFNPANYSGGSGGVGGNQRPGTGGTGSSPSATPEIPTAPPPAAAATPSQQAPQGGSAGLAGSSPGGGGSSSMGGGSGGSAGSSMGSSPGSSSGGGSSSGSGSGAGPKADAGTATGSPASSSSAAGAGGDKSAAGAGGRTAGAGMPSAQPLAQPSSAPLSAPAPAAQPAAPSAPAQPSAPTATTPAAASAPGIAGASGGGAPAGAAPTAGAPVSPPVPLGPPTTPSPPAPVPPGAPAAGAAPAALPGGPGVAPASTGTATSAAGPAPVPVSAARAEREAVASAATAGALRRQHRGNDPVQLARRIAAALNANVFDFGFYWVTALTTDHTIVVANSYGIGYIPVNVHLPQGVQMATADESIPAADRARWATYPILAVQGWTQHHNQRLRVVIATEDQFQGFDPGAAKIVLQPEDIPVDGTMQGRTRLEVLAPGAAATLAATRDDSLSKLLPPAHTDATAPKDKSAVLWFEVCKPLMSTSTARGAAHLAAMRTYSDHAMQLALHRAQTATDVAEQRTAIADWVYWQHESSIIAEAIESTHVSG